MKVFEVTGRAMRREKFNLVWRCGAPWPASSKDGPRSITHQLRVYVKASDPMRDELVIKEKVLDEFGDEKKAADGRVLMRPALNAGTGAPQRRTLKWCVREDGSRVVECYADTFELAKHDELFEVLDIKEIDPATVISIADAKNGESYEDFVARAKPKRSDLKGAASAR